jgi:hypothetical protein
MYQLFNYNENNLSLNSFPKIIEINLNLLDKEYEGSEDLQLYQSERDGVYEQLSIPLE